jgi:hypothetical protein
MFMSCRERESLIIPQFLAFDAAGMTIEVAAPNS